MAQSLNIKIAGLYLYPSDLSAVPEGALSQADNIIIDRDSIAEPRRGFDVLQHGSSVKSTFSDPSYRANKLFFYQKQVLAHYSSATLAYNDSSSGWTNYTGTFSPPSATVKVRSVQASQNFYFTTSTGVFKLDSYTATPKAIGVPLALDTTAVVSASSTTFLASGSSVNYRIVWGITDANNNLILGAPSQIITFTNVTASQCSVDINFTIPAGITTSHFYQIYRSATAVATVTPNDELGLVYEASPVAGDISNGSLLTAITDFVPDTLRGATLYTSPSQEGIGNANQPPPFAYDLADFRNCMFYGNTTGYQNYTLTMLGTGSPSGVQANDTLVIGGVTYTAKTSETIASGYFQVYTAFESSGVTATTNSSTSLTSVSSTTGLASGQLISGTSIPNGTYITNISGSTITMSQAAGASASGVAVTFTGDSAATAIRHTSLSLVKIINRYASSTVTAYYLSGLNDLPGKIYIQAKTTGTAAFVLTASRTTNWNPSLPSSGTTASSTNTAYKNAVYYSKVSQPEAVALGNYIFVGSADKNILRIIALRDSLFIFKEDGIFRLYGTDPTNFLVSPLDFTAILTASDTAVALNNQIYALTTQGVVSVSETGVQIMSHPIENALTSLVSTNYSLLQTSSFGVAYESSRAYYLFCISNAVDTVPTQYFRYNYITNTWTRGTLTKTCGGINPVDDTLCLGNATNAIVDIEKKNNTYSDYADYQSTQVISAVSGTQVTISSSDTIAVGSIISQSSTNFATVASINAVTGVITTTLSSSLTAASADVLSPIPCAVAWTPVTLANPGMSKQLREATLLFNSDFNGTGLVGFTSDVSPQALFETIVGGTVGGWGEFGWGGPFDTALGAPWGGDNRRRPVRVMVPRNHQRSTLLTVSFAHSYGYSPWRLQGISLIGDVISERVAN